MVAEKVFAVIAESTRRDILEALAQESKAVGQLVDELGVSQPTVSKHLRVLREAGVVTMRAQGQKRFYGINTEPLALVSAWLESLGAVAAPAAQVSTSRTVRPAAKVAEMAKASEASKSAASAQSNGHERASAAKDDAETTVTATPGTATVAKPDSASVPPQLSSQGASPSAPVRQGMVPPAAATSASPAVGTAAPAVGTAAPAVGAPAPAARVPVVAGAPIAPAATNGHKAANVAVARLAPANVQSNDGDGGMQGQISRSVGRAANKAVDLLANLPALPKLRRKKD